MRIAFKILFFLVSFNVFSQEIAPVSPFQEIDSLYREDQFYFGITYNQFNKVPAGFSQNGISTGINFGFLRDMPINKKRTYAIAIGLGLSYNKWHNNLKTAQIFGVTNYAIVDKNSFSRNKTEQVFVDLPVELRWRNSTPESHKFWRIYTGFKLRYLIFDKSIYNSSETVKVTKNSDFNQIQYGPYIAFGFNTWNLTAYYGLKPVYKSAKTASESLEMKTLNIGLIFYIL
jgi:hypothetical protein